MYETMPAVIGWNGVRFIEINDCGRSGALMPLEYCKPSSQNNSQTYLQIIEQREKVGKIFDDRRQAREALLQKERLSSIDTRSCSRSKDKKISDEQKARMRKIYDEWQMNK